jgi:Mycothiol maleylpyruvate isomerase N-terminal domain
MTGAYDEDVVASWDVAQDVRPLDVRALMRRERQELVSLLSSLSPEDWHADAIGSWDVHAVTLHLFRSDFVRLREGWNGLREGSGLLLDYAALTEIIERGNDAWVEASRQIPTVLIPDLLLVSGGRLDESVVEVDMEAPGVPVAWTGSGPTPVWLDLAREYTDRWVHHQQIRDAVGKGGLRAEEWMRPVLETFMLALPRAYDAVQAPQRTTVRIVIGGASGGTWYLRRDAERWRLVDKTVSVDADVHLPEDVAWRLYVRMVSPEDAISKIERRGDPELTEPACRAVAVMTSSA